MTAVLRLTPVGPSDGRRDVTLALDDAASLQLGRSSKMHPNAHGIRDPRVSRCHIRIFMTTSRSLMIVASGQTPVLHIPLSVHKQQTLLNRGQSVPISSGDEIELLPAQTLSAHQKVAPVFQNNRCAYRATISTKRKAPITIEGGATIHPEDGSPPFKVFAGDLVKFVSI